MLAAVRRTAAEVGMPSPGVGPVDELLDEWNDTLVGGAPDAGGRAEHHRCNLSGSCGTLVLTGDKTPRGCLLRSGGDSRYLRFPAPRREYALKRGL